MKRIEFRTADDSAALNPYAGELGESGTLPQVGLLKNTGDVALSSIRLRVQNEAGLPGILSAVVNGVTLGDTDTEVLTSPLAVGATVPLLLTWTTPASILSGEDSAGIVGTVA